jgi:hypothetical protein
MEIASIKGDTVHLLYHPAETAAEVGQQFKILELPGRSEGLIAQIISNDSLEYSGIQQEMIQNILEQRITKFDIKIDHEEGMDQIKSLKLATAKIRKRIQNGVWRNWDGWIPTRNVEITQVDANELLKCVLPSPQHLLQSFTKFNGTPIQFDGSKLNMVNVIAGVKGSGKSHLAKHLVLSLVERNVPCVIFDINGEYIMLPNSQILKWGDNFIPDLAEVGYEMLSLVVKALYPLPANSESVFEGMLPVIFAQRRSYCDSQKLPFTIDIDSLKKATWKNDNFVQPAIEDRLRVIGNRGLFLSPNSRKGVQATNIQQVYEQSCKGQPIIFDMRDLTPSLQRALVKSINNSLESICVVESRPAHDNIPAGQGRYPFVFFEEAHFYISPDSIINIITRGRHIGLGSVFVTNTPQNLPDTVFRQLDNLFLLALTHKDDIKNVSKNSFTDEDTIQSFATRMPEKHALIMGNITDRYPLLVKVDPLPASMPPTGQTKSTWDRFAPSSSKSTP